MRMTAKRKLIQSQMKCETNKENERESEEIRHTQKILGKSHSSQNRSRENENNTSIRIDNMKTKEIPSFELEFFFLLRFF